MPTFRFRHDVTARATNAAKKVDNRNPEDIKERKRSQDVEGMNISTDGETGSPGIPESVQAEPSEIQDSIRVNDAATFESPVDETPLILDEATEQFSGSVVANNASVETNSEDGTIADLDPVASELETDHAGSENAAPGETSDSVEEPAQVATTSGAVEEEHAGNEDVDLADDLKATLMRELKDELREELRAELKEELKAELKAKLKSELRNQINNELRSEEH